MRSLFHRGFAETSAADLTGVTQILYYYILSVNVRVGPWLIFDLSADRARHASKAMRAGFADY